MLRFFFSNFEGIYLPTPLPPHAFERKNYLALCPSPAPSPLTPRCIDNEWHFLCRNPRSCTGTVDKTPLPPREGRFIYTGRLYPFLCLNPPPSRLHLFSSLLWVYRSFPIHPYVSVPEPCSIPRVARPAEAVHSDSPFPLVFTARPVQSFFFDLSPYLLRWCC